jgi:hypothetical protein
MLKKIKILFLSANPSDTSEIELSEEVHGIESKLQSSKLRDSFKLITARAVRSHELQGLLLRHRPHILHFSGHGTEGGAIVLQNERGESSPVEPKAFRQLLEILKDNLQIVVLNACYTAKQAKAAAQVIDFTIGVKKEVLDEAAIAFSASFYQALANERSVKEAFNLGRSEIALRGIDCDVAVLLEHPGSDSSRPLVRKESKKKRHSEKGKNPSVVNKRTVNIGRDANGSNITTGDQNTVTGDRNNYDTSR